MKSTVSKTLGIVRVAGAIIAVCAVLVAVMFHLFGAEQIAEFAGDVAFFAALAAAIGTVVHGDRGISRQT